MTIAMQGRWTVEVKSKSAAWPQRFRIDGSTNGFDGTYDHDAVPITVEGDQWGITVEHDPPGVTPWRESRFRLANWRMSGDDFIFDIETDDFGIAGGGDKDFNDLILTCTTNPSPIDFIIYGQVQAYYGSCTFNPCYPILYYIIDDPWQLRELLQYSPMRRIIKKLYPERVREFERIPPVPHPEPGPFIPMMIPSGLSEKPGFIVDRMAKFSASAGGQPAAPEEEAQGADINTFTLSAQSTAATTLLDRDDLVQLARFRDQFGVLKPCFLNPVSQTLMRFIEYDRTAAEKLGDPYTGEGNRHILGTTATDEFGNYIFRFTVDLAYVLEEFTDIAPGQYDELYPDLMIQLLNSLPDDLLYETAPYYNIPNIKRINLCMPYDERLDLPRTSCQGGRAIQELGNLSIITAGTTLEDDGTVTNIHAPGPIVDHAAWYGTVDLFACFLDTDPTVKHYVIRHRRFEGDDWTDWEFVEELYKHSKQQENGAWAYEKIGPDPVELRVNGPGIPKESVGAYLNIEDQFLNREWKNAKRDRKLQISTSLYQSKAGLVEFRIEGYDEDGEFVPGAEDTIRLFIDNKKI